VTSPFSRIFYRIGSNISDTLYFLGSISDLRNENEELIMENNELASSVASLTQEKNENKVLREQLNLVPKDDYDLVSSFVSAQDAQGLDSWIYIDKGTDDGIEAGMPVIVSDGILIGFVEEAYLGNAKVSLLTGPSSVVNAVDINANSRGIIKGEYGLGLVMGMISQSDSVNEGDDIVTSGLGSDIPKGLLIGKVKEVHPSQDNLFKEASIVPRVKYSKLDVVFVIKDKK